MRRALPLVLASVTAVMASANLFQPAATPTLALAQLDIAVAGPGQAQITDPPAAELLLARAALDPSTCGFWWDSTLGWDWWTCNDFNAQCTNSGSYRQCCDFTDCPTTTFWTTCMDSIMCPGGSIGRQTLCCTDATDQYCTSFLFSTTRDVFTFFACGADVTSRLQHLYTASAAQSPHHLALHPSSSLSSSSSPSSSSPSLSTTGAASLAATRTATTASPPAATTSAAATASLSTGALIGVIAGGAIILAAIGVGVFFMMRARRARTRAPPPPGMPMLQPPVNPYPPQSPYQPQASPQQQQQQTYPYQPGPGPVPVPYGSPAWTPSPTSPPAYWQSPHHPDAYAKADYQASAYSFQASTPPPSAPELDSTNVVGAWGGNNRAELG